jgi:hypothetical protein
MSPAGAVMNAVIYVLRVAVASRNRPAQRLVFSSTPLLELALILYGIGDAIEPLRKYEGYWPASRSVTAKSPRVVLRDSCFQRRARCSDVEDSIRTSQNIEKSALGHFDPFITRS